MYESKIIKTLALLTLVSSVSACEIMLDPDTGLPVQNEPTPVPTDPVTSPDDPRLYDPAYGLTDDEIQRFFQDASCDALSDGYDDGDLSGNPPDFRRGLRGKVSVPPTGYDPNEWRVSLDTYTTHTDADGQLDAVELPNTLFFSGLNIPTRPFDSGFPLFNGNLLTNANGDTLIEDFRLDFDGFLELTPEDPEGDYEIAFLADDGIRFQAGLEMMTVDEYASVTPTRMVCPQHTVNMMRDFVQPMHLAYFQGPRYHIALTMLWRKKDANTPDEPLCGASGNDLFFDSTQTPSAPQPAYNDLLSRGWNVVKPENFRLPDDELFNPCMSQKIRDFFGWD
jgi:hypothetical protein